MGGPGTGYYRGSPQGGVVLMYSTVTDRLQEIVPQFAHVWPHGQLQWDALQSSNDVEYVHEAKNATWMIASSTCSKLAERLAEFSCIRGVADFALVGDEITHLLPATMHVTSVERYPNDVYLIVGKKVRT